MHKQSNKTDFSITGDQCGGLNLSRLVPGDCFLPFNRKELGCIFVFLSEAKPAHFQTMVHRTHVYTDTYHIKRGFV